MSFGGFMLTFKRHVAVINYDHNNLVYGQHTVHRKWLLDGHPISLNLHGTSTNITARDVGLQYYPPVEQGGSPSFKRWYEITSKDGSRIDNISSCQSTIRDPDGLRRYESDCFPDIHELTIGDEDDLINYLAITIAEQGEGERTIYSTYTLRDYLRNRGKTHPILEHPIDTLNGEAFPENTTWGTVLS